MALVKEVKEEKDKKKQRRKARKDPRRLQKEEVRILNFSLTQLHAAFGLATWHVRATLKVHDCMSALLCQKTTYICDFHIDSC